MNRKRRLGICWYLSRGEGKGTVFFFPRNSLPPLTHSIFKIFFFFSLLVKKKIQGVFATNFSQMLCFFFFLRKSLKSTHSLKFRTVKKKKQPGEKKKNRIFTHSVDFFQNVVKIKLFRGKKKYGTFVYSDLKSEFSFLPKVT